jgi:ATP-dependent DNA helicase RecQ
LSPAYIFSNDTLEHLIRERPATPQDLGRVKGIGPAKLERYGKALLEVLGGGAGTVEELPPRDGRGKRPALEEKVLGDWVEVEEPEDGAPKSAEPTRETSGEPVRPAETRTMPEPPAGGGAYVSTEEWTVRLLERGFSLAEAAAIRGLDLQAVARHALWMARKGRKIEVACVLEVEDMRGRWRDHLEKNGPSAPPEGEEGLGFLWTLFVACGEQRA